MRIRVLIGETGRTDIGGLDNIIEELREAVIYPLTVFVVLFPPLHGF